ncbi:hypothetical protein [Virgibacillus alimentarius]|nr:hypothetical protein [Virgibacillus alimentarius]
MPRETENTGSESTPHFDGKREGILNDSKGIQMGIKSNSKQSPYRIDDLMEREDMER